MTNVWTVLNYILSNLAWSEDKNRNKGIWPSPLIGGKAILHSGVRLPSNERKLPAS